MKYKRIVTLRKEQGLTQTQFAEKLGTTQEQISKYERGIQDISAYRLIEMSNLFNVSVDYILELTDKRDRYPKN